MNHAGSVTLRAFGLCSRSAGASWPQPSQMLFRALHTSRASPFSAQVISRTDLHIGGSRCKSPLRSRTFDTNRFFPTQRSCFSTSPVNQLLKPYPEDGEHGLSFRKKDLDVSELAVVFPDISISRKEAHRGEDILTELDIEDYNRLLRVLHARRVDGTVDVPVTDPALLYILETFPDTQEAALTWLRHTFPVDEDEAILARFRREEAPRPQENPSVLTERGQKLGLLKMQDASTEEYYGPQSGAYYAKLSEKGADDVFGRSELERIRAENEAKYAKEEEEWEAKVDKSLKEAEEKAAAARTVRQKLKKSENTALEKQSGKDVELAGAEREIRPPNTFEKWVIQSHERATSDLTLESPEIVKMTTFQRLFPSLLLVLLGSVGCYFYAQVWEPPRRNDRWLPDVSLSVSTCLGIFAVNFGIFLLWRFPPARSLLNKYFLVVPAYPYALSCVGNLFSHWTAKHFAMNMLSLFIFGPSLHEEIGRGNFLGIYLAAGLIGSFASLSAFTFRGVLTTSSQGASGCVWGIMAAYLWLHKDDNFSFIFVPKDLQGDVYARGWMLLVPLVVWDIVGGIRAKTVDVVAHQAGMIVGLVTSQLWKNEHPNKQKPAQFGFIRSLFGGGPGR